MFFSGWDVRIETLTPPAMGKPKRIWLVIILTVSGVIKVGLFPFNSPLRG